jgi:transcription initiation factor TFIID subunit 8
MDSQSSSSSTGNQHIVRRRLQHVQQIPEAVEPAPQDPEYAEGQLLKSISAALTLAGFDSVKPTALEMFRSHAEECKYMPHSNTHTRALLTLR